MPQGGGKDNVGVLAACGAAVGFSWCCCGLLLVLLVRLHPGAATQVFFGWVWIGPSQSEIFSGVLYLTSYILAGMLRFYLAFYLSFFLPFYLASYLTYTLVILWRLRSSGAHWGSGSPRLRSSGAQSTRIGSWRGGAGGDV